MRKKDMKASANTAAAYKKRTVSKILMTQDISGAEQRQPTSSDAQSQDRMDVSLGMKETDFMAMTPELRQEILQDTIERLELRNEAKAERLRKSGQVPRTLFHLDFIEILHFQRRNSGIT
jgi:hypothetical protein